MEAAITFDLDVPRCTRRCFATDRELAEGELVFSALVRAGADYERRDYAADAWTGPPAESVGWWKAEIPRRHAARAKLAPDEVLWQLFTDLADRAEEADKRYVLALFLIRRKLLKLDDASEDTSAIRVFHTRSGDEFEVQVASFDEQRAATIQQELMGLLYAGANDGTETSAEQDDDAGAP